MLQSWIIILSRRVAMTVLVILNIVLDPLVIKEYALVEL